MWGFMDYKPIINRFKYSRNVPLRSPKAEIISKDMIKRGFRFVGPVIVHSFMQAAGLTIDHLVDCFRHGDCVSLAERPWRHIWCSLFGLKHIFELLTVLWFNKIFEIKLLVISISFLLVLINYQTYIVSGFVWIWFLYRNVWIWLFQQDIL